MAAFVLPLLALLRTAEARPVPAHVSAIRIVSAAGVASVLLLLGVSAALGSFCLGCAVTYVVVAGYAGIALPGWPGAGLPEAGRGATIAGVALLVAFGLVLYPGMHTPRAPGEAGREAIAASSEAFGAGVGTGDGERDRRLEELVKLLSPAQRQTLSDSLLLYRQSPALPPPPPRRLDGPSSAPVLITEWTDVLCGHCAELSRTLATLREHVPSGSFAVDARQFPLDGDCNPYVGRTGSPVRCLAAQARICFEGREGEHEFTEQLYQDQQTLTPAKVFALAERSFPRAELEACVASPETAGKLRDDIEAAARYEPDGTPIVAINGRRGTSFGPFLLAMVLTGGADAHPAFAGLPSPNPQAHLH